MKKTAFTLSKITKNKIFCRNFGIYNLKLNVAASSILKSHEFVFKKDNFDAVLSFDSGIGFLTASMKRDDKIIIGKYTHDNNYHCPDLCYLDIPIIACGRNHSLIYGIQEGKDQPCLISFGNNLFGQCGDETLIIDKKPSSIKSNIKISQLVCGLDHSLIVTDVNKVLSCGLGTDGQTGLSMLDNVARFTEVRFSDPGTAIRKVSSRADTVMAVSTTNQVFAWGNNEYGQILVNKSELQQPTPVEIDLSSVGTVRDVLAIGSMCFVTTDKNKVFGWGFGVINGVKSQWMYPTEVKLISMDGSIVSERISEIMGSVHYGVVMTESRRLFLIGNYPNWQCTKSSSNEIVLPRPVKMVKCGVERIFATFS